MSEVRVGELVNALVTQDQFSLLSGDMVALNRVVKLPKVQRVGVALTGHVTNVVVERVQLLGRTEMKYLKTLTQTERRHCLEPICSLGVPALVVTSGVFIPEDVIELCNEHSIALFSTSYESTVATDRLNQWLFGWFAPREVRHGVLVDVHGVGVLLLGKSGIGKSEIGLELVSRGHRLVADDVVMLKQAGPNSAVGHSPDLTRNHMEIRGLGIINIRDLYGVASVRERKRVELAVELVEWDELKDIDRLGLDYSTVELVGVPVQIIKLPVRPGRSLSLIIEVAARNRLLQAQGTHSAEAFSNRVGEHIREREDLFTEPPSCAGEEDDE